MSVYIILYTYIHIIIKECDNRSWFFTLCYGDFTVQSFETYRTQRQAIVVYSNIDLDALVEDNKKEKKFLI